MKPRYAIGIDPGIKNGIAIYCRQEKQLVAVNTLPLHELFEVLRSYAKLAEVYIENPNTYVPFKGVQQGARLQGAGAVKQTYKHIIHFLEAFEMPYKPTKLQGTFKKIPADKFQQITGFNGKTNEHGRDAAMIAFRR